MEILNYTGRVIALFIDNSWVTYFPNGQAKLNEEIKTDSSGVIDIKTYTLIGIDNLPHKENNVLLYTTIMLLFCENMAAVIKR